MSAKTIYTAHVHTVGGREGAARSSDNQLDIRLASPGSGRPGANPEQLFAAGWSACFEGALGIAAKQSGVELPAETAVDARSGSTTVRTRAISSPRGSASASQACPRTSRPS